MWINCSRVGFNSLYTPVFFSLLVLCRIRSREKKNFYSRDLLSDDEYNITTEVFVCSFHHNPVYDRFTSKILVRKLVTENRINAIVNNYYALVQQLNWQDATDCAAPVRVQSALWLTVRVFLPLCSWLNVPMQLFQRAAFNLGYSMVQLPCTTLHSVFVCAHSTNCFSSVLLVNFGRLCPAAQKDNESSLDWFKISIQIN